ncbi:MAG: tRNA 2-thiouridine(34) synthase MnmA [Bacteroidales bacterium]|nr:tRNA 2-thiouridine(34) synthase MnmA [Bacteroidales bacterium]MCP5515573.1 tRNA 2-thiouridine(34) synthase MnmA [Spirochaetales bacterium]
MSKRVVVGLSGGVDSSVAAYLLKEQGYDVTAVFMINWHDKTGLLKADCPWDEDVLFAELVAKKIGIPFHVVDLSEKYRSRVVEYMFAEYEKGRTPNPDVLCNREIKFDEFFAACEPFNPDFIATGHYCKKDEIQTEHGIMYRLLAGDDPGKEQSYFLCQLSQEQLKKTLFPIGHLRKSELRDIARKAKLPSAEKKDSQGICFVGKVSLPDFLQQQLKSKEGDIIEIPENFPGYQNKTDENQSLEDFSGKYEYTASDGEMVGKHIGAHYYTIGQRKGLNVGGKAKPLFIIATDTQKNIIYVGQGQDHPGLFRKGLFIPKTDLHWIRPDLEMISGDEKDFMVRIRYRQPLQEARLYCRNNGMYIIFRESQRGITPGQFAAWYSKGELIGSGVID